MASSHVSTYVYKEGGTGSYVHHERLLGKVSLGAIDPTSCEYVMREEMRGCGTPTKKRAGRFKKEQEMLCFSWFPFGISGILQTWRGGGGARMFGFRFGFATVLEHVYY